MTRGQTREVKEKFLAEFARTGVITRAAESVGTDRKMVYRWRQGDPEFEAAFKEAEVEATEHLEEEARRRAHDGVDEPVYQGGVMVGTVRKYSDTLLIFLLKGRAPQKYRERIDTTVSGPGGGPVTFIPWAPVETVDGNGNSQ